MQIRHTTVEDYPIVMSVIDSWWGRPMQHLLPRLFFEHFKPTNFVVEEDGQLVGFCIGFISQTNTEHAYIHFVGVNPTYRMRGIAHKLYTLFIDQVKENGCKQVNCITTPINTGSIAFHEALGFQYELVKHYAGQDQHRIVFTKNI